MMPSYFVAHTYFWGDTHLKNLGQERATRISPAASTLKAGIPFTFSRTRRGCSPGRGKRPCACPPESPCG